MGTTYSVKCLALPTTVPSRALQSSIDQLLEQIEQQMSTYRLDAELSRFNRHAGTNWFAVAASLAEVVAEAQHVSQITDGAFDVTVGPLVDLWGFGPQRHTGAIPDAAAITATRRNVGYQRLEARLSPPALRKSASAIRIDLSGIAKGYAVDAIARRLDTLGITNHLVAVGGELKGSGVDANGRAWRVGIEQPDPTTLQIQAVVPLANRGVSTSGDYRNSFEANGRSYGHIIDPRTGRPPDHSLASVAVVHESSTRADALATALMVLGPERGYEFATRNGLACLFILRAGGEFVAKQTKAFARLQSPALRPIGQAPLPAPREIPPVAQPTLNQTVFK